MVDKSFSARIGHIKRKINQGECLKGKTLELALQILNEKNMNNDKMFDGIGEKLKLGQKLTDYEYHIFVEIVMKNKKLEGE
jgi:hypothetical protein